MDAEEFEARIETPEPLTGILSGQFKLSKMCEIKGKIKVIKAEQVVSDKFKKREFVVTTEGEYPQHVALELTQDKCGIIDKYQVGQDVTVSINVRGREWTSPQGEVKHFNTLQAWRIESAHSAPTATHEPEDDGLPFS